MLQIVGMEWQPCELSGLKQGEEETHKDPQLQELLLQFADILADPVTLPPSRGLFDHRIPLEQGTNSFSIKPYRYPLQQKDVIEALV